MQKFLGTAGLLLLTFSGGYMLSQYSDELLGNMLKPLQQAKPNSQSSLRKLKRDWQKQLRKLQRDLKRRMR